MPPPNSTSEELLPNLFSDSAELDEIRLLTLSPKKLKKATITSHPTPMAKGIKPLSDEEKIARIEHHFRKILEVLGLDLENGSLAHTSYRVAKMYVKELFMGLDPQRFPKLCFLEDAVTKDSQQMIFIKNICLSSFCEHHFVPMTGIAHIAYIPHKKVIGLSKINRIANYFCRRPQLQERLTSQIVDSLRTVLETEDIAIFTKMQHFSVTMRGAEDRASSTETTLFYGRLKEDRAYREEFISRISN